MLRVWHEAKRGLGRLALLPLGGSRCFLGFVLGSGPCLGSGKREVSREWGRSIEHHRAVLLANGPSQLPKFIIRHPWSFPVRGPSASQSIPCRRASTRPGHRGKSPAVAVIESAKEP